jgi:hypothetical protein
MSMDTITEEQIKKIYNYLEPLHQTRYSDWVVEMRRQISLQMLKQGVSVINVAKVVRTNRMAPYHYRRMTPRSECHIIVNENLWKWIEDKVYPRSLYRYDPVSRFSFLEYELSTSDNLYPGYKKVRKPRKKKEALDSFIDKL